MRPPSSSKNSSYQENLLHAIQETFKKYNVNLEMCINDSFIMVGFMDFLRNEHNASSLEFVVKIDEYSNSHNPVGFSQRDYSNVGSGSVNSPSGYFPSVQTNVSSPSSPVSSNFSGFASPGRKTHRKDSLKDLTDNSPVMGSNPKSSRKTKAKEIIDRFLNERSAHQVNLSSQIRDSVLRQYKEECDRGGDENDINPHLFDEARFAISVELKIDSFVRFLKSQFFVHLIITKVEKEVSSKNLDSIYKFLNGYFSKIGELKRSPVSQFITNNMNIPSPTSPGSASGSGSGSGSSPLGLVSPGTDLSSDDGSIDSVESITHINHVQTMLSLHSLSNGSESKIDINEKFTKTIGELEDEHVTDDQFNLLHELINHETLWVKVHEDSESLCYVSENKFYHNKRGLKIYKEVGIIEATPEEVLNVLIDMRILDIIDDTMSNVKFERYVTGPFYSVSYLSSKMKMAWPVSDRQFLVGTSVRDEPKLSGYTILRRSHDWQQIPVIKGCIKAIFLGGVIIEKLSEKHTRFTASGFVDMGGKFPLVFFNKILTLRQSKGVENVKKGIAKRRNMKPDEQQVNSENSFRLLDTLLYSRELKTETTSSRGLHTPSL